MICYRDRTFCPFYTDCIHGDVCKAALTPQVKKDAELWWGSEEAPIAVWKDRPHCFSEVKDEAN
jgi:hypothetical protein